MQKYNGWLIVATFLFYLASVQVPSLLAIPTLLAWLIPVLMWRTLGKAGIRQALIILSAGIAALVFSASKGIFLGWKQIFSINLPLLAMFTAVSFLTLTNRETEDDDLPKGSKAAAATAAGTHLLGSVINLSVLFVFADRLQKRGTLTTKQLIILTRSFCAAAWWSPFFIATGVALTYAPGMQWQQTLVPGAVMAVIAICYSLVEVCCFRKGEFSGYPIKAESLTLPLLLAAAVIFVHYLRSDVSVLHIICVVAPLGALAFMKGRPRFSKVRSFINTSLSTVNSQFALFLAAGVFSAGIKSVIQVYPAMLNLDALSLTPLLFAVVLASLIFIGILGVHPIVSIAVASPMLMPLAPDPSQLGFLFLTNWAASTPCSPLSGVGLALVSRYKVSPWAIITSQYGYAIAMWLTASLMNVLFFAD